MPKHSQSPGQEQPEKLQATRTPQQLPEGGTGTPPPALALLLPPRPTWELPRAQLPFLGTKGTSRPHASAEHIWAGQRKSWRHPFCRSPVGHPSLAFPNGLILVWQGEQAGLDIPSSRRQLFYLTMIGNLTVLGPSSPAPSGAQPESSCPLPGPSLPHFSDTE